MEQNNSHAKEKSIVLVGPIGVGKSIVAEELAKQTGLPHIWADTFRECPKDLKEIQSIVELYKNRIENLEKQIAECSDDERKKNYLIELDEYKRYLWRENNFLEQRRLLPDLPNYFDFGFDPRVANYFKNMFGVGAWHMYHKQFENMLLEEIVKRIDFPCILDLGGGMGACPEKVYHETLQNIESCKTKFLTKEKLNSYLNLDKIKFSIIENSLKDFGMVVELVNSGKTSSQKMQNEKELNDILSCSKDYDRLANYKVDTAKMFDKNCNLNEKVVKELASRIVCEQKNLQGEERLQK